MITIQLTTAPKFQITIKTSKNSEKNFLDSKILKRKLKNTYINGRMS